MAAKKVLFIEGEPGTINGNLREGFAELLKQKLYGKLPKIKLGGGKKSVIDQFLNNRLEGLPLLLVDLDGAEETKHDDLKQNGLGKNADVVFYMIQEMEAWFLSQPDVIDRYYGVTVSGKKISEIVTKRRCTDVPSPKEELKRVTQQLNKGEKYHEIKHAVDLLQLLDATKLEEDFPDFKRLIEKLK